MKCRIRVIKEVLELWPECRPEVGKVYDADYYPPNHQKYGSRQNETCVVDIKDKRIVLRKGEFEIVED